MRDAFLKGLRYTGICASLMIMIVCLAACNRTGTTVQAAASPTTTTDTLATSTMTVGITSTQSGNVAASAMGSSGVKRCPAAASSPAYWDQLIPTQANTS